MCKIEQNKDQVPEELKEQVEQEEQQEQEIEPLDLAKVIPECLILALVCTLLILFIKIYM